MAEAFETTLQYLDLLDPPTDPDDPLAGVNYLVRPATTILAGGGGGIF
jgi:hypothetical protein